MRKLFFIFLFLGMAYSNVASAMMEITIYLTRSNTDQASATTTYDYVDKYQLEVQNTQDFIQAVNGVTGLNLVQSGPTGQNVSLFMRGGDSNHTLVTMNGLPIKDASTTNGLHDFGQDFMSSISAIEIIKNPSGAMVGPNSIGGVVNFITGEFYENSITFKAGSNNTKGMELRLHNQTKNGTHFFITASGTDSDGISVKEGTEDDGYSVRNFSIGSYTRLEDGYIKTNILHKDNDSDLDGTSDDPDYTANNKNNVYQIIGKKNNKHGHMDFAIGHTTYDRTYTNGSEIDEYDSNSTNILLSQTIEGDKLDIVPGIEYEAQEAKFDNRGSYTSSVDADHWSTAYFINGNWRAVENGMISTGIRLDHLEDYDDYYTYKLGGYYYLTEDLKLRTNWSNSVRTPTLYEKYGADNFGYSGNPNLDVEKGETLDFGFTYKAFDMVYYTTDIDNAITYGNSTYSNVSGTSERKGVEANYNYVFNEEWQHNIGGHWNISEDSSGKQLLRRPKWTFNQSFVKHELTGKFTTTVTHSYMGEHVDLDASTWARKDMPGVHLFDLHHSINFSEDTSITASLMNVTDEDYERPDGYNQNGRTWLISYKKKF